MSDSSLAFQCCRVGFSRRDKLQLIYAPEKRALRSKIKSLSGVEKNCCDVNDPPDYRAHSERDLLDEHRENVYA